MIVYHSRLSRVLHSNRVPSLAFPASIHQILLYEVCMLYMSMYVQWIIYGIPLYMRMGSTLLLLCNTLTGPNTGHKYVVVFMLSAYFDLSYTPY